MTDKILACKSTFEVLSIIDKKVELIKKKATDKSIVYEFIDRSLLNLRHMEVTMVRAWQLSVIRVAIGHLKNLVIHYKMF